MWERLSGDMSYDDKTKLGDIPHQLVITISEFPKKRDRMLVIGTAAARGRSM